MTDNERRLLILLAQYVINSLDADGQSPSDLVELLTRVQTEWESS